jgi:hypothetical protein
MLRFRRTAHVPPFWAAPTLALCLLATASCAAPSNNEQAAGATAATSQPEVEEIEEPLALSVDALDIRHGTLRIEASMDDGSADVSMWLGESCETREVGHGIATRTGFAWSLSRDEIARAIECSLTVKVHGIDDEGQHVRRVAQLPVSVAVEPDGADLVRLRALEADGATTKLTFMGPSFASRLHVAGTIIGPENDDIDRGGKLPRGLFVSAFVVDNDDLARSMLARSHLTLLGEDFLATVTVGSVTLDISDPQPDSVPEPEPVAQPEENEPRQGYYDDGCDDCGEG